MKGISFIELFAGIGGSRMKRTLLIGLYLVAIISANLLTTAFGAGISIVNAFFFIGLDLTTRDYLHEIWSEGLWWKMGLLIAGGSFLSWIVNHNAGTIAIASFVAFAIAGLVDTFIYQRLKKKSFMVKVNGSNVFSSLTDSIVFPAIAFRGFLPLIVLGQFGAKVVGGFVWSLVLRKFR